MEKYNSKIELVNELQKILINEEITSVFQPIVSLKNGNIIGYEALSRGPEGSELHSPANLFALAKKLGKSWDLEAVCRKKTIESTKEMNKDKLLFINVDPHIFKESKFRTIFNNDFLSKYNINHKNVVLEITEKNCVNNSKRFAEALNIYKEQGYKIALDDTGSGYSGLKTLSDIRPHYMKIDIDLIRDIHKDRFKQAIIESTVKLAESTNMQIIAEGIECKEELLKLIDLGVHAAQGYFLCKPQKGFYTISKETESLISTHNYNKNMFTNSNFIGQIESINVTFNKETKCKKVSEYFNSKDIPAACIVENNKPVGIIMKHIIDSKLATQYGVAVFLNRPIELIMDYEPIIVDYYADVQEVSSLAMNRSNNKTYDCIIVTKNNNFHGIVTIKSLLEFITTIKFNYAKELNPLTGLPGNIPIQQTFNNLSQLNKDFGVFYLDLDNFKVYNDTYGFKKGDRIINLTAEIITEEVKKIFDENSFVGHIGGDDFICIIDGELEKCHKLCQNIIKEFNDKSLQYFNEEHIKRGIIVGKDRDGIQKEYSLVSISIAGIYGELNIYSNFDQLATNMANLKKRVKEIKGSSYIIEIT